MNEFAERIERDYPVRHKEKEKVNFRAWLVHTLKEDVYKRQRGHSRRGWGDTSRYF